MRAGKASNLKVFGKIGFFQKSFRFCPEYGRRLPPSHTFKQQWIDKEITLFCAIHTIAVEIETIEIKSE